MSVRAARPEDAAALAEVAAATFPLACPPSTTEEAAAAYIASNLSEATFARHLADPDRILLVAQEQPGAPFTGYAMLVRGEPVDPDVVGAVRIGPTIELSKLYVVAAAHGRGAASELMAAILAAARRSGAAGIWLGTNEDNARARRFYAKHGFAVVGTRRFRLGDEVEDDVVLERAL